MMFSKVKTLNVLPRWIILLTDLITLSLAALLAYLLRFNFNPEALYRYNFLFGVLVFMLAGLIGSLITRSFAGIIIYTGFQDTLRVLYTSLLTLAIVFSINYLSKNTVPFSVALIAFFVSLVALIGYRLLVKELFSFYRNSPGSQKKVVIFGVGSAGLIANQLIDNDTESNVKLIAFLEDNPGKIGKVIAGIKVYSARNDFERIAEKYKPQELILAVRNLSVERKNELADQCLAFGIKMATVPFAEQRTVGKFNTGQIMEVKIEDLLGRNIISLQNQYVNREISGKSILVTGAAGSIGSGLVKQLMKYSPARIVLVDQSESGLFEIENEAAKLKNKDNQLITVLGNICNKERMRRIFDEHRPDYVFHAAAYKHVPMMEFNPIEAVMCNMLGTKYIADFSVEYEVEKFVMVSTDKAVNPTSVMGASKRAAEIYVQSLNDFLIGLDTPGPKFITTRFGNVLGSNGSVIPVFKKQIEEGGPVTVTHPEITRYFMTIPEACDLVLEAGVMGQGGEIFVFDMGKPVKILEMAKRMIQLSGLEEGKDIDIVFTGLRPGEKLYEELLDDKENSLGTHHPKIMISKVREFDFSNVRVFYDDLEREIIAWDNHRLVSLIKKLVAEYKSNESGSELPDIEMPPPPAKVVYLWGGGV